jgi:glycosyltransferase involved in cell wall biosynthesis
MVVTEGLAGPRLAIVVPVHNALEHVQRSLTSLGETCPWAPLIVVDDCSDDTTHRWLVEFLQCRGPGNGASRQYLLRNERQQLFTRTVNRGIRWADARHRAPSGGEIDFVAVANSDCVLYENWLKALLLGMDAPTDHAPVPPTRGTVGEARTEA